MMYTSQIKKQIYPCDSFYGPGSHIVLLRTILTYRKYSERAWVFSDLLWSEKTGLLLSHTGQGG